LLLVAKVLYAYFYDFVVLVFFVIFLFVFGFVGKVVEKTFPLKKKFFLVVLVFIKALKEDNGTSQNKPIFLTQM